MKIKFNIDLDLVDRAEEEAFQILLKQRLSFNDRWHSKPSAIRAISLLRIIGLLLSILGVLLSTVAVTIKPDWYLTDFEAGVFVLLFILAGLLFYFLPAFDHSIKNWVKKTATNSCRRLAKKCVKAARNAAPYEAEYDIKGNLISYYRGQDDNWQLAWSRKLKGVAIHGKSTTLFFRRWTSIQPTMVVLHKDFETFANVLADLNIEFRSTSFDQE